MTTSLRCWAEIDVAAMRYNIQAIRSMVAKGVRIVAVVKADGYGHGLSEIARRLDRDIDLFGVANLAEAQTIRLTGAMAPILILGPALPSERQWIVEEGFIPTVSTVEEAAGYAQCVPAGDRVPIHFVVDTGMGRIGLGDEECEHVLRAIREMPELQITAFSTHLPVADEDENYTALQLQRFRAATNRLLTQDQPATVLNSAGILRFRDHAKPGDLVRAGLSVYGVSPLCEFQPRFRAGDDAENQNRAGPHTWIGAKHQLWKDLRYSLPNDGGNARCGLRRRHRQTPLRSRDRCFDPGTSLPLVRQSYYGPDRG